MQDRTGEVYEWLEHGEIFVIVSHDFTRKNMVYWKCLVLKESTKLTIDPPGTLCTFNEEWFSSANYRYSMRRLA